MKDATFRAISLIVLLIIPNITSSHQPRITPKLDNKAIWGAVEIGQHNAGKYRRSGQSTGCLHGRMTTLECIYPRCSMHRMKTNI